jgi:hypothetical protein
MQLPAVPLGPALDFPDPFVIPTPVLELPSALIPEYEPLPPYLESGESDGVGMPTPKVNAEEEEKEQQEKEKEPKQEITKEKILPRELIERAIPPPIQPVIVPTPQLPFLPEPETEVRETTIIQIPGTDIDVPVPTAEILSAAAATSVISVGATLTATSVFKRLVTLLKPLIQQVVKRIQKLRGKKVKTWARQRLESHQNKLHKKENQV